MRRLKQIICLLLSLILVIGLLSGIEASALEETELELSEASTTEDEVYPASDSARGVIDVPLSREYLEIGSTTFNVYWDSYGSGTWELWKTYRNIVYALSYYPFKSGAIGYCIEPYSVNTAIGEDRYPISFDTIPVPWLDLGYTFEHEKQEGIALVMAYGAPNNGDTTEAGYYATAMLVWDMACGYRKVDGSLRFSDSPSPFYSRTKSHVGSRQPAFWKEIDTKYQEILECLAIHGTIPSFSARYAGQVTDAHTITLNYDSASGLYKGSATDTNKVLKNFNYVSTINGLTFTKSGNTLNITATAEAAAELSNGVTIRTRGNEVEVGPNSLALWGTSDDAQVMVTLNSSTDPVPSYFKLRANTTGNISGTKTTDTGVDLEGWEFQLLKGDTVIATAKTDSSGKFSFTDIPSGTYTLVEIVPSDSKYECTNNSQSVTVTVGSTTAISFHNKLKDGKITFTKETNTGNNLGDWEIKLYSDSALTDLVGTYKTGADGKITTGNLASGTYYAKETASTDPYWESDSEVKTIKVEAGETATATFSNTHYGKLKVIKSIEGDGPLDGWQFKVTRLSDNTDMGILTSQADGTILSGNLLPGDYQVEEIIPEDSLYYCKTENPVTITVKVGETAEVNFTNTLRLRSGKLVIEKVNPQGDHLAGAKFLLEWKNDEGNWEPVVFSDKEDVIKGGCSSAGLADGTLVTDSTGIITFDGLHPGLEYRVTEIEAPDGYQLLSDYAFEGTLPTEDLTVNLQVVNSRGYHLPDTGVFDSGGYISFGSGIALAAFLTLIIISLYCVFTGNKRREI